MKRYVFDIETDNLLRKLTTFHCAGVKDHDTGEEWFYNSNNQGDFQAFLDKLDEADVIVAHNAWGFDVPALMKLAPYWTPKAKVTCTKVLSQVLNFARFSTESKDYRRYLAVRQKRLEKGDTSVKKVIQGSGHSLARWGIYLSDYKGEFNDFSQFSEEMYEYLKQDVRLGAKVYATLLDELKVHITKSKSRKILDAIEVEHQMERIMTEETQNGWKMNLNGLSDIKQKLEDKIKEYSDEINPKLLVYVTSPDMSGKALNELREQIKGLKKKGEPEENWPEAKYVKTVFTKKGKLTAHVSNYFELDPDTSIDSSPVLGPYTRVSLTRGDIGNTDQVKDYLSTIGWEPDEWNWKRDENGKFNKTSSKLTESSLEPLGRVGEVINEFYTLRSRLSIINGWDEHIDVNNRLHGDVFNIGTPTFRQTHNIIANLPSGSATLGPEIRSAFIADEGKVLVSADSAACQLRLLAHFMDDPKFTRELLEGDVHQLNADIIECTRPQAKRFIFAYLYGAGAPKLSGYIDKSVEETKKSISRYKKKLPKLAKLIDNVSSQVRQNGYVVGLDTRKLCLDASEQHKALNYLIQGAEAVIMKATVVMIDQKLKEANIDFKHLLFYHDEHTVEVREDQAEEARGIIMKCFAEAPKAYGINIMTCGDCKIGKDYYEVH